MNIRAKISLRLAQKAMDQAGLDNMKELVEDEVGASIIELQQRNDTSDKVVIEAGEPARANDRHFVVVPEPICKLHTLGTLDPALTISASFRQVCRRPVVSLT